LGKGGKRKAGHIPVSLHDWVREYREWLAIYMHDKVRKDRERRAISLHDCKGRIEKGWP